jgi:hypothetical protein
MCRTHGQLSLSLELLSDLLTKHTAKDIRSTIDALLQYIPLPGNATAWLPPAQDIPLVHAGVLDLHQYPMASQIAQQILSSLPVSVQVPSMGWLNAITRDEWKSAATLPRAAFFAIHSVPLPERPAQEKVVVYRVGVPAAAAWPPRPDSAHLREAAVEALTQQPAGLTGPARLHHLMGTSDYGPAIHRRTALGGCLAAELEAELSKVAVQGRTGSVKVECCHVLSSGKNHALWAITW